MTRGIKSVNTGMRNDDRELALCKNMIAIFDESQDPADNSDRAKKIGKGDGTAGAAIVEFDGATLAAYVADGFTKGKVFSKRPLNPDNFFLHLIHPDGKGIGSVYGLRLTVDDKHKDSERDNLSTPLINQCEHQGQALSRDIWKAIKLGAKNKHPEMAITPAGFPWALKKKGSPNMERLAWATNISKRGGYVTDGVRAAQFWHFFCFTAPGGTTTLGCGDVGKDMLVGRGDAQFMFGSRKATFAIGDGALTDGDPAAGHLWIGPPMDKPPDYEPADESSVSNQTIIPRSNGGGIRPIVFVPQRSIPPDMPRPVPSGMPSIPANLAVPVEGTQGVMTGDLFQTGVDSGYVRQTEIPNQIPDGYGFNVYMNFVTPAGGIGANAPEFRLEYVTLAKGDSASPGALTESITKNLDSTTYSGNGTVQRAVFRVDGSKLRTKKGGKFIGAIYRMGSRDTNTSDFLVTGVEIHFGKLVSS